MSRQTLGDFLGLYLKIPRKAELKSHVKMDKTKLFFHLYVMQYIYMMH